MDRSELEIIKELMAELEAHMEPSEDDFSERLGRPFKEEGDIPKEAEIKEEMMGDHLEEDEESRLKDRLMRLRR